MPFVRASVALLLLALSCVAGESYAFRRLASVKVFAFGGVGIAGTITDDERAFHEVLESRTAEADFRRILESGNPQAQCYGLVGLRLTNRAAFDEKVGAFANSRTEVDTAAGCMVGKLPLGGLAASIRAGTYDRQAQRKLNGK